MSDKKLSIAIISDLHCHPSDNGSNDTYLNTDMLRTPILDHPVESIIKLIKDEALTTDLTLCPGDFTNKSNRQGFISGWDFSLEVHNKLKGEKIIATIGNHDVDSFGTISDYSYEIARGIKKGFPYEDPNDCDTFWSKGCAFVEGDNYRILVINSSHFHYTKKAASSGKVSTELTDYIDEYLSKVTDDKICITLAHHHPIDHSRLNLGEEDKIINADGLLEILGKYKFDLFIHGHKHDPLLRYYSCRTNNHNLPILSSGSFSSTSNISFTGQRNTFHIIDLIKSSNLRCKGRIRTWSFMPKSGWKIRYDEEGFHSYTGFGYEGSLQDLANKIKNEVGDSPLKKWEDIVSLFPDVEFLIPTEADELVKLFDDENLILAGGKISEIPKYIGNTKNVK
jgi:3',5'-cyclic AMP phosphodiesterase CpdA